MTDYMRGHDLTPEEASNAIEEFLFEAFDVTGDLIDVSLFAGTADEVELYGNAVQQLTGATVVHATVWAFVQESGTNAPVGLVWKQPKG